MRERIKLILKHFGLTQAELAETIGGRQSTVGNWLSGADVPQSTAMALQLAIGVRWQWLLNGEGEMLAEDTGSLSDEERVLIRNYRKCDPEGRREILEQAQFNLGRSLRRWDISGQKDVGRLGWVEK